MAGLNRSILVDNLRRLVPQTAPAGLPALSPAAPIAQTEGVGLVAAATDASGSGSLSAGSASTHTVQSSDGLFAWQFTTRPVTLSDGSTVNVVVIP